MPLSPRSNQFSPLKNRKSLSNSSLKDQQEALKHDETQRKSLDDNVPSGPDYISLLSDKLLQFILSKLPEAQQIPNSLVCKRWEKLSGRLIRSLKLLDWGFVETGRLIYRFPNLSDVDLVRACIKSSRNSGILLSHRFVSVYLDSEVSNDGFIRKQDLLGSNLIDQGIRVIAEGCLNLRKLVLIGVGEEGLTCVAEKCKTLQELELHCCSDFALKGISGCQNLQILKLIGCVDGFYDSMISDIGLTILAQGCRRLVKLELVGCEGSFDGIKAVGQCCQMLEEFTLCDHRMDGGWSAALSYCGNLKTLKLQSCKSIDTSPGPDEHLGSCPALEELHLQRCHMGDKQGARALFLACQAVRELVFEDCWGLDNIVFGSASICRRVRLLSLEGCSLLSVEGLEPVVLSWKELKRLKVVSCNNIKDSEISSELATLFSVLKELKWRPDSTSLLSSGLAGTGIGQKGGRRSFKRK